MATHDTLHSTVTEIHREPLELNPFKCSTGLFIIIGTTFGGWTEPQSNLTKILSNDFMKIIFITSYDH